MVTVIEGCNEYCTFCIVPYTRGKEVSRTKSDILEEVNALVASGLKEIELLGQTINAYACPSSGIDFADLLAAVAEIPKTSVGKLDKKRIRSDIAAWTKAGSAQVSSL